jgi:hypothetical protein
MGAPRRAGYSNASRRNGIIVISATETRDACNRVPRATQRRSRVLFGRRCAEYICLGHPRAGDPSRFQLMSMLFLVVIESPLAVDEDICTDRGI